MHCLACIAAVDLRRAELQQSGKNSQAPAIRGGTGAAETALFSD
jgi:hypothetical protein